jgi:hypothetical protein
MKRLSNTEMRRHAARTVVREILENMISGNAEVYVGYRQLYRQWCRNNAAVPELGPLFRIPGICPDGPLSVDENFKMQVIALAHSIVPQF